MIVSDNKFDKVKKLIENSKSVLICINNRSTFDTHLAALAITQFLKDLGVTTSICINGKLIAKHRKFFKEMSVEYDDTIKTRNYVISLDHSGSQIEKVSYDDKAGKFNLYIKPAEGTKGFDFSKVTYSNGGNEYDLVFVFGARKLEWLGDIYKKNKKIFSKNVISINNIEGSNGFGTVSLVDTEIPVSQIVYKLVNKISSSASSDKIVQLLLCGILDHIQLLQSNDYKISTIESLTALVKNGADLKLALKNIYFQKSFTNFQIIQKVMSNVEFDTEKRVVWSKVSAFDFAQVGVKRDDFELDGKIIFNLCKDFGVAFILYQITEEEVWLEMESNDAKVDVSTLMETLNVSGNSSRVVAVITEKSLDDVEKQVLDLLDVENSKTDDSDIAESTEKDNSNENGLITLPPISPSV